MSKQTDLINIPDAITVDGNTIYVDSNGQDAGYNPLQIGNTSNSNTIVQILSANNGIGTIHFGDAASGSGRYIGFMNYDHTIDQFQIGTNDSSRFKIDASGRVTMPSQPYFNVRAPGTQYVTVGGYVGFTWSSEVKDVGGNFASNVFTAPVTGVYSLTLNVRYDSVKDNASYYNTTIATSNRSHAQLFSPQGFDRTVDYWVFTMNVIADMDAGDTASCNVGQIGGSSGTSINGSTAFYGYLLG